MDELQKAINRMIGVSDETWEMYNPGGSERRKKIEAISLKIGAIEQLVNRMMRPGAVNIENIPKMDEVQKSINAMMGITDAVWQKYCPKI